MRGFNIAVFGIPPIALSPVLVITLPGDLAADRARRGERLFSDDGHDAAGPAGYRSAAHRRHPQLRRRRSAVLRWLRLRSCLPGLLGGLRVAAPAAILGAILAEFGSGARWGLGSFLLGSLGRGDPARIWGIGLTATAHVRARPTGCVRCWPAARRRQ